MIVTNLIRLNCPEKDNRRKKISKCWANVLIERSNIMNEKGVHL